MPVQKPRGGLRQAAIIFWTGLVAANFGWAQEQRPLSDLLVEVTRGSIVESRHYGRLVAVAPDGKIRVAIGDPQALVFPRSALKPMQALATIMLAGQGVRVVDKEIAMICASHGDTTPSRGGGRRFNGPAQEGQYCGVKGSRRP
jgi:hypothetical protein